MTESKKGEKAAPKKEEKAKKSSSAPVKIKRDDKFSYYNMRYFVTQIVSRSIYVTSLGLELGSLYRYYYQRDLMFTLECLVLIIVVGILDLVVWTSHWKMTYDTPGYINDV